MSYPDQYRDRGNWPDSRGARQRPHQPPRAPQQPQPAQRAARFGGAEGNERLTAITGAVLLILLAVEGLTILRVGRLLTLHFFLGMLLLGPVALKAGSVIYRFARLGEPPVTQARTSMTAGTCRVSCRASFPSSSPGA